MKTELGQIQKATFGWGGYQDTMIGLSVQLGGKSWGVADFKGMWGTEHTKNCKWTQQDQLRQLGEACMFLRDVLIKAKKQTVDQLVGVPVEVTFDNNTLKSWRVLEEVI